jgi:hypothetical protein
MARNAFLAGRSAWTERKGGSISSTRRNNIPTIMWLSIGKNAARNGKGIASYVDLLADSLRDLEREVVTFWIINREREGLELCKKYMEMVPFSVLHIVRNGYYGEPEKFQLYENSKLKITIALSALPRTERHGLRRAAQQQHPLR